MKTTFNLPDDLLKAIKVQARKNRIAFDVAVEVLLRNGLLARPDTPPNRRKSSTVTKDKKTGLPLIECKQAAAPQKELTPDRVADILLAQEVGWHHPAVSHY